MTSAVQGTGRDREALQIFALRRNPQIADERRQGPAGHALASMRRPKTDNTYQNG